MTDKPITPLPLPAADYITEDRRRFWNVTSMNEHARSAVLADRALNATAQGMWQPIETAPKDGTPILGWCQHTADAYYDGDRLTDYGARAEGLSHVEDGPHVLIWGESYEVSDGWENPSCTIPAGWELSHDCEVMANPTHWMPLPEAPTAPLPAVDAVAGEPVIYGLPFSEARRIILDMDAESARGMAISLLIQLNIANKYATPPRAGSETTASASVQQPIDEERLKRLDYEAHRDTGCKTGSWAHLMTFARAIERDHGIVANSVGSVKGVMGAEVAHRQGCDALGGYGHGVGPCSCGAAPSQGAPNHD